MWNQFPCHLVFCVPGSSQVSDDEALKEKLVVFIINLSDIFPLVCKTQ